METTESIIARVLGGDYHEVTPRRLQLLIVDVIGDQFCRIWISIPVDTRIVDHNLQAHQITHQAQTFSDPAVSHNPKRRSR